jgi:2-hydroxychromene-2-carboxylate isomerase
MTAEPETVVDFYFDVISPYAYLASRELPPICERNKVELRLHPVLFAGLLGHWGQRGPAEIPPKAVHTVKQVMRYAMLRGIPCRPPRHHPFNPLTALRVCLPGVSGDDQPAVVRAVFELGWGRGGDPGDAGEIAAALDAEGLDGSRLLERAQREDAKAALRQETDQAIAGGVFGVPTMIVNGELFWGLDQLEYLELTLQGRDPLSGLDWDAFDFRGPSAWRTGVSRHDEE